MDLGGAFSEALIFAKLKHGRQARRGTAVPYLSHLLAVTALVLDDGGSEEEAMAALLHDAAEDHGGETVISEIADRFGEAVAEIVAFCTDPPDVGPDWREVKRAHLNVLATAAAPVRRVSLAEKLDNARAIVRKLREVGPDVWSQMRVSPDDLLWYFGELADLFAREHPGAMSVELTSQVGAMRELA